MMAYVTPGHRTVRTTVTGVTTDVPGLEVDRVSAWLASHAPDAVSGPVTATLISGGRSNLTYLLEDGTQRFVLRRPPLGHVLATAHDMGREHRMISALQGTAVPVPRAVALCEDVEVTGAPFYVMSHVDGAILRRLPDLEGIDAAGRAALATNLVNTLADLHAVDVVAVGLADHGRPEGFMARQVRRWSTQLEASRNRDLPGIEDLRERLAGSVPEPNAATVVHGDYRLDNLVAGPLGAPDAFAVRAVLDWEMATIGDPLSDVGLLLSYWDGLGTLDNPIAEAIGTRAGFPDGPTLLETYAARSGRDVGTLGWYVAFGFFKLAVILEGIHYRFIQGQTVGAGFESIGDLVPDLVRLGGDALRR